MYKTVVFDMDGTILDTLEDMKICVNKALVEEGFPERTLDEVRRFVGNGNHKLAERAVPEGTDDDKVEAVFQNFHRHYKKHCGDHTRPYSGVIELIRHLREAGIRTAVVSNKADYGVQALCADWFPDLFDGQTGEKEGVRRKPAPDGVWNVMAEVGARKDSTVYIGDSEVDIETARNAGLPCISVSWGFRDENFLKQHGASVIVHTMDELEALLLK